MDFTEINELTKKIAHWERRLSEFKTEEIQLQNDISIASSSLYQLKKQFYDLIKDYERGCTPEVETLRPEDATDGRYGI